MAGIGIASVVCLSILGAGIGVWLTGTCTVGAAIGKPQITNRNMISVLFCEAVAIYGILMGMIMVSKVQSNEMSMSKGWKLLFMKITV